MNTEAFCYALLLRAPSRTADLMKLLSATRQSEIQTLLGGLQGIPEPELRRRWRDLRALDAKEQRRRAANRTKFSINRFSPKLQAWIGRPF
jgi:hypothetical protein